MKPIARHLIFIYLLESNVIQSYLYKVCLYILREIKKIFPNDTVNLRQEPMILNKNNIHKLAKKMAQTQLRKRNWQEPDPLYDNFYINGGIYYYSGIEINSN
jgi:hypothetical protein